MMIKGKGKRRVAVLFAALLLVLQLCPVPAATLQAQAAPVRMADGTLFDPEYYAQTYPDVKAAFGNDAAKLWQHYTMFGIREGRSPVAPGNTAAAVPQAASASAGFDPVYYANRYPDLKAAFGYDAAKLWQHYTTFGIREGRSAVAPGNTAAAAQQAAPAAVTFDPVFYANRYPDLKAAFGNDAAKLWQHYRMYGEKEGRQAAANHVPGTKISAPANIAVLPVPDTAAQAAPVPAAGGRRVAFIGDSITTFAGHNPPTYAAYYPKGDLDQVSETWWHQVSARAGLQVVANASWTGSCVSGDRNDTSGAVGCGPGRVRAVVAQAPDIVFIQMGVCDFGLSRKADDFRDAYRALVRQLRQALPNALIICCTCLPFFEMSTNDWGCTLEDYNRAIRDTASEYGCHLIDTNRCGLTREMTDDGLHPNAAGAAVIANYVLAHMPQLR